MKKTMKITMSLIMMIMLLGGLTACGKSEEEKAMDEVGQHLRDEAAADGVDLDKMVSEEAERYNSELEEGNKAIANENEFKESLKNNEMVPVKEQYEIYENATDSATAKKAAEEFNKAYDKYIDAAIGEYIEDEYTASRWLNKNDIHSSRITDGELQTRIMYLDNCYGKNYSNVTILNNGEEDICILMWNNEQETISDMQLVYSDSKKIIPTLSAIDKPIASAQFIVKKDSLIITNYLWAYEFTEDNQAGTSIANEDGSPIYPEGDYENSVGLWENTIEEYNSKINNLQF